MHTFKQNQLPGFRFKEGDVVRHPDFPSSEFVVENSCGFSDYETSSYTIELRKLNPDGSHNPEEKLIKVTDSGKDHRRHLFMPQIEVHRKLKKTFI